MIRLFFLLHTLVINYIVVIFLGFVTSLSLPSACKIGFASWPRSRWARDVVRKLPAPGYTRRAHSPVLSVVNSYGSKVDI